MLVLLYKYDKKKMTFAVAAIVESLFMLGASGSFSPCISSSLVFPSDSK